MWNKLESRMPYNPPSNSASLAQMAKTPTESLVISLEIKFHMVNIHPELFKPKENSQTLQLVHRRSSAEQRVYMKQRQLRICVPPVLFAVRLEVLMAVKMSMLVLLVVMLCRLVGRY
jgi:hypothetical protein